MEDFELYKELYGEEDLGIYNKKGIENLEEDDEISVEEAAFMKGYAEA